MRHFVSSQKEVAPLKCEAHLQDRAEMPREKYSPPPAFIKQIRPQDLQTANRPDFIDDIVRELTERE